MLMGILCSTVENKIAKYPLNVLLYNYSSFNTDNLGFLLY